MTSNIEPQTTAKCILYTTKGDIAVEMWAKECPETSRRFLTDLSNGAYVNGKFNEFKPHQWIRFSTSSTFEGNAVVQERNPRIKFNKDGLFGWDRQRNTWFITVEADSKHALNDCNVFGKIVGKSIYAFREILSGEIETFSHDDEVKQFMYPAVLKDFEITIPFFEGISLPKRKCEDDEKLQQQSKRKIMKSSKVQIVYEDEEEDDYGDDDDALKTTLTRKMILPSWINSEGRSEKSKSDVLSDEPQEPSVTEPIELHNSVSPPTNEEQDGQERAEEEMDKREQETLEILAKFQQQMKSKKILK
ncbi:cwc27p [Saccharomyces arboricola H-6]|uniref:Cwc27p n=1 Tax=Saccharomyces arboricola (strain H-6 / AS 2.3317 / CBS 10644) TaxID=1160507 RepID=J8PY56_SACAR|nr:cwc27p [Saccharomyces arboricola H-6]